MRPCAPARGPVNPASRAVSSVGRALRLHRRCRGSSPSPPTIPHDWPLLAAVFLEGSPPNRGQERKNHTRHSASRWRHGPSCRRCLLVALVALSFAFRTRPSGPTHPTQPTSRFLAQDVHLRIGGVRMVLPLAALEREARFHTFRTDKGEDWRQQETAARAAFAGTAHNPAAPLNLNRVYLGLRAWASQDAHGSEWARLCPALSRNWAQSICNDPWAPLLQSLPDQVTLADARHLDVFKDTFLSFGDLGNADTLLQSMKLGFDQPRLPAVNRPARTGIAMPCGPSHRRRPCRRLVRSGRPGRNRRAASRAGRPGPCCPGRLRPWRSRGFSRPDRRRMRHIAPRGGAVLRQNRP